MSCIVLAMSIASLQGAANWRSSTDHNLAMSVPKAARVVSMDMPKFGSCVQHCPALGALGERSWQLSQASRAPESACRYLDLDLDLSW
jgi:hypothetical protein